MTQLDDKHDRVELSLDGSHACALLGADLQSGEAEFAPIEGWPNATYKQEHRAMSAAYEALAARIGKRPPFDIVREHATTSAIEPAAPFIELAEVLKEYDAIVDGRLDPRDAEADFVMRGSDWRVLRAAFRSMLSWPKVPSHVEASDVTSDKAYLNGFVAGWNCGMAGDRQQFDAVITGRETELRAAVRPATVAPSSIERILLGGILDASLDAEDEARLKRAADYAAEVLADVESAPNNGPLKRDLNDNESLLAWAVDYLGDVVIGMKGTLKASSAIEPWIPVGTSDVPVEGHHVIVFNDSDLCAYTAYTRDGKWYHACGDGSERYEIRRVTRWRELPPGPPRTFSDGKAP